jgi:hypothetical protein
MTTNTDSPSLRNQSPRDPHLVYFCLLFCPLPSFSCSSHRYQRLAPDAITWRTNNNSPPCIWGCELQLSTVSFNSCSSCPPISFTPDCLSPASSAWRGEHRLAGIIRPLIQQSGGQLGSPLHLPNPTPCLFLMPIGIETVVGA